MGTTMSFYLIENRDITLEMLRKSWGGFQQKSQVKQQKRKAKDKALLTLIKSFMNEEQKKEFEETFGPDGTRMPMDDIFKPQSSPREKGPVLAWREGAKWLPLFEENLCDGYNASSRDAERLGKAFGAPVLAFSIFDSDILFVSYADPIDGIHEDYAKPNFEGFEDYDVDRYKEEFPAFLCAYGDEQTLREIWEGEEVFADDRMLKLCEAIGAKVLYDGEELPEGYERVEQDPF